MLDYTVVVVVSERKWGRFRGTWGEAQCALVCWWGWLKYGSSVVFISTGADDECGFRKQEIAVVRCPLDSRIGDKRSEIVEMLHTLYKNNHLSPQILLERRKIYQSGNST